MVALPVRMRPAIVLFGDSITQQGFGWEGGAGWVSLLSASYSRRADVLNRGFSGYNTRHGVDLLPNIFGGGAPSSSSSNPNMNPPPSSSSSSSSNENNLNVLFVTIFFGANDAALPGEQQHVPIDEYGANLERMISYIQNLTPSKNENYPDDESMACSSDPPPPSSNDRVVPSAPPPPIILFTPPPVDVDAWYKFRGGEPSDPNRRNDRANTNARDYGTRVKEVAAKYSNCSVLDVFDLLGGNGPVETYSPHLRDGLHLSGSGNTLVYEGLMKLFAKDHSHLLPMMDGDGRYGTTGVPLEEKLWRELC